jgi:hypothetical protein
MIVHCTEYGLIPCYSSDDYEKHKYFKIGEDYEIPKKKAPRNWLFHKKYMALFRLVWENLNDEDSEKFPNERNLRKAVEMEAGHSELIYSLEYGWIKTPKSVSYEDIDQVELEELFEKCFSVVQRRFMSGNTRKEIEAELMKFY